MSRYMCSNLENVRKDCVGLCSRLLRARLRSRCFWCRAHEQDLSKRHERDLGELTVVHHRETHIMLADFNKAQEVLKDKISALQILWVTCIFSSSIIIINTCNVFTPVPIGKQQTQISHRLEGTEEKLRNRESRPEDLHVIAELREMVSEREALVKKLVVSRVSECSPQEPDSQHHRSDVSKPLCSRMTRSFTSWSWSTERPASTRSLIPVPMLV